MRNASTAHPTCRHAHTRADVDTRIRIATPVRRASPPPGAISGGACADVTRYRLHAGD